MSASQRSTIALRASMSVSRGSTARLPSFARILQSVREGVGMLLNRLA